MFRCHCCSGVKYKDFTLSEIDLKRKFVKKYGANLIIRVKFTKDVIPAPKCLGGVSADGIELVVREGDAIAAV